MNRIKRVVLFIFILIVAILIIVVINPYKRYRKQQIEKQLFNAITTGKIGKDISRSFEKEYNFAIEDNTNIYKIDEFIKYYINLLDTCILIKEGQKNKNDIKEFLVKGNFIDLAVLKCEDDRYAEYIVKNMTEEDINDYNNHIYHKRILNDLEKIFIHKSNKEMEDWYLTGDEKRTIELHYNYYVKYTPNDKKRNIDFDRILSLNIISPVSKIDEYDKKNDTLKSVVQYITKSGEIKELKRVVLLEKDGKNIYYSPTLYLSSLFYSQEVKPTCSTGQHDYDLAEEKKLEEWNRYEEEYGHVSTGGISDDFDENGNYIGEDETTVSKEIYDKIKEQLHQIEIKNRN